MPLSPAWFPAFLLAGAVAGFLNTVAGGGSFFSFPLLILLGYPPQLANGTIRVTIVMQNLVAVPTYARAGYFLPKPSLALASAAIPSALIGSLIAARLDPEPFRKIAAVLLLAVLVTLFLNPAGWTRRTPRERIRWAAAVPLMAAVGFYGGFFQLGAGMPFLAVAVLAGGWDLLSANALKVAVILLFAVLALGVFAAHAQVDWRVGITLGLGNMAGAWAGARAAVRGGPRWIRWILVGMALLAAGKLVVGARG